MENRSSENIKRRLGFPRPTLFAASGLVLLAAIGLWVTNLAATLLPDGEPMGLMLTINIIYYLPFILIPAIAYAVKHRGLSDALRLNPMPVLPLMSVIFLAGVSTLFASILTALWSGFLDLLGLTFDVGTVIPETSQELLLSIIVVGAIPAVCEELLFRGFVLSAWETRGTKFAVIVSSVLFALIHGNIYGLPAYIFVGALSGYLVFAMDSVYVGMIFHTIYNTACLVINYLTVAQPVAEEAAAAVGSMDNAGLILSMGIELIFCVFLVVINLATIRMRQKVFGIEPLPRERIPLTSAERAMLVLSVIPMIAMIILF